MYTQESLSRILDGFIAMVDEKVASGAPNAGRLAPKMHKGLLNEQRYVNGDTTIGRTSVTVLERFMGQKVVRQLFSLANHSYWRGEDAPKSDELDESFYYVITIDHRNSELAADFVTQDNAGWRAHLVELDGIDPDDDEAFCAHIESGGDFYTTRPINPGEIEYVGYLLALVILSKE